MELDLVFKIVKDHTNLINAGNMIKFRWIPSHVNIPSNERADSAAKKVALCLPVASMKLPPCEAASSYLVFLSSVLRSTGKTFGIVLQTTNFMCSAQLLTHHATMTSLHVMKL